MNANAIKKLSIKSLNTKLSKSDAFEILGELISNSKNDDKFLSSYISDIVAKGTPIDQFLEYGIYKILEDKKKITQEHYSRIATLCNAISEEASNEANHLSKELLKTDNTNFNNLLLRCLALLHNWRPLEAWPYAVRATEVSPTDKAGYNLLLHIAIRLNRRFVKEEITEIFERTRTDKLQVDILREDNFKFMQYKSKDKVPAIMLNTQMKSGTIYLRGMFSSMLSVPHCQVSISGIISEGASYPLKNWLRDFGEGGAVCVDHFDVNEITLNNLIDSGIFRMVVHTRDIRKSALSSLHFAKSQAVYGGVVGTFSGDIFGDFRTLDYAFEKHCQLFIPRWQRWLKNWIKISENSDLKILFTSYEDFLVNEEAFTKSILQFYDIPHLYRKLDIDEKHKLHFRVGDPNEYEQVISKEVQLRVNNLIDPEIMERFGWK